MTAMDAVRMKFREASDWLAKLSQTDRMSDFYPTANAFLSAARSVLYVAGHELGLKERRDQAAFSASQLADRDRFDTWFAASAEARAVLAHPLTNERHVAIHRSGQAGFSHVPKPIGGLAIGEGSAFRHAGFLRGGRFSLPLEDKNSFFYVDEAGRQHDAVQYCAEYLALVDAFFRVIQSRPWR
jgi:hypothetical protein